MRGMTTCSAAIRPDLFAVVTLAICAQHEISSWCRMRLLHAVRGPANQSVWTWLLIAAASGLLPSALLNPALAQGQSQSKEAMLNDDLELVQRHCARGAEDNRRGLSAFNDAWVKQMQTLRFEAGVAPNRPDGSNDFLAALSAAMHVRCPDVW